MIILEGPDGSGKTSLIKKIRKETDRYTVFLQTNGCPDLQGLTDIIGWLASRPPSLSLVCDRFSIISEYIYGPILRDYCLHNLKPADIARWLNARSAQVVYCRPSFEMLLLGRGIEPQREGVLSQYKEIVLAYDDLMLDLEVHGAKIIRYRWEEDSFNALCKEIL